MTNGEPTQARFERVNDAGELIFSYADGEFAVPVDVTLERAVLEARQVGREAQSIAQPPQKATLPISQIQSLIRAGAEPANVAERYDVSEALVRRFSSSVEQEKQYAIEQFRALPAPKESRAHTMAELIERMLAGAGVDMETVKWRATRRGIEPWRIEAQFNSDGHQIKADWTWNMRDNTVECLNNAARKLVGEPTHNSNGTTAKTPVRQPSIPGDSVRSARIERVVSAWNTPQADESAPAATNAPAPAQSTASQPAELDLGLTDSPTALTEPDITTEEMTRQQDSTDTVETAEVAQVQPEPQPEPVKEPAKPAKPKRRTARSAVPSWDEILFGD